MTKRPDAYSARVIAPAIDSKKYIVSVLVMRRDGKKMTDDDLAVAAKAFPPTDATEIESHPDDDAILEAGRALGTKSSPAKKASKRGV